MVVLIHEVRRTERARMNQRIKTIARIAGATIKTKTAKIKEQNKTIKKQSKEFEDLCEIMRQERKEYKASMRKMTNKLDTANIALKKSDEELNKWTLF